MTQSKIRDIRFDFLKCIGILGIILAHSNPPYWLDKIRTFDVPLMVIVSGTLFYYSCQGKEVALGEYLKKRIPRLIAPVWFFLGFFFSLTYIVYLLAGHPYPFSLEGILSGFLLLDGINYVWIIRVFMLIAILAPFLLKIQRFLPKVNYFLAVILGNYIFYELALRPINDHIIAGEQLSIFIKKVFLYMISYGCLYALGMALPRLSKKNIIYIIVVFFVLFSGFTLFYYYEVGGLVSVNFQKNPPGLYYISYGIFMSMILYIIIDKLCEQKSILIKNRFLNSTVLFISSSSLWIYLWHILFIQYWNEFSPNSPLTKNFLPIFVVVSFLSVTVTYLQKEVVKRTIAKTQWGSKNSELLTILFLK